MAVYLLTGCANGIGRHLAGVFYRQGHSVMATDVDIAAVATLTAGWDAERVLTARLDVRQPADWQAAIAHTLAEWGRIDVGLNIAGTIRPGYVAKFDVADVDFMVDTNLKGVMHGTRLLAEAMLARGGGTIINFASLAGVAPIQGLSIYSATKFGVRAFSIAAAGELRKKGVRVSVICPDLVDTNMLTLQLDYPEAALSFSGGRILTLADIEQAVVERAIGRGELEVMIPRRRGWLGKLGNLFPALGFAITERLRRKGETQRIVQQGIRILKEVPE